MLDHLPATQPYQELSYQERIAPNPSYARYFQVRLQYKTMDEKAQPVLQTCCFLFSQTGRLTQVQVCE